MVIFKNPWYIWEKGKPDMKKIDDVRLRITDESQDKTLVQYDFRLEEAIGLRNNLSKIINEINSDMRKIRISGKPESESSWTWKEFLKFKEKEE